MAWVLIVTPTDALRMVIKSAVKYVLQDAGLEPLQARNLAEADALVRRHGLANCRLVLCSPTVPRDGDEVPAIDGRQLTGLAFARGLREGEATEPPVIFVGALADTQRKDELASVANSAMVVLDDKPWEQLPQAIRAMLKLADPAAAAPALPVVAAAQPRPPGDVDLDIILRSSSSSWRIKSQDGGEDGGTIAIPRRQIEKLVSRSQYARKNDGHYLNLLGEDLFDELMRDPMRNDDLRMKLQKFLGEDGMKRARIRFTVDEDTQPILLETLADPAAEGRPPEPWMLRSPMFRKLGTEGKGVALFRQTPVHCLLVQGQTDSFERDDLGSFDAIRDAEQEITDLEALLKAQPASSGIGRVDVLRRPRQARNFAGEVEKALGKGGYQMVHYAGHSALGPQNQPWLVLGRGEDECVHAADFAEWARGHLQFVFLSSCDSADSRFIHQMVQHTPAVIGYAWPADDQLARQFARTFYRRLFGEGDDGHMLEYSFMAAKKALHRQQPAANDWAAPLLFMQVMEAGHRPGG